MTHGFVYPISGLNKTTTRSVAIHLISHPTQLLATSFSPVEMKPAPEPVPIPGFPVAVPLGGTGGFPVSPVSVEEGAWSSGLYDCCSDNDCGLFCLAFWCPCITFGKVAEMVGRGSTSCGTSGALYGLLMTLTGFQLQSAMSCTYRARLRAHYSLPDAPCCDCCVHYWCGPCALVQEYKELKARGLDPDIGWQHLNLDLDLDRGGAAPGVQHMGR